MPTIEQVREQLETNTPEVKSGQLWRPSDFRGARRIRVVCRYPFSRPEEGRAWVTEEVNSFGRMMRMPEVTLRTLFVLTEDVE